MPDDMSMAERVARALYERNAMYEQPQDWEGAPIGDAFPIPWDDLPEHGHPELHGEWLDDARAAVLAIEAAGMVVVPREATPEMEEAGRRQLDICAVAAGGCTMTPVCVWGAMLDQALTGSTDGERG